VHHPALVLLTSVGTGVGSTSLRGYAYLVPFVETKEEVFLKTIIPSRKATRIYLDEEH
jgi:hypothetical protein